MDPFTLLSLAGALALLLLLPRVAMDSLSVTAKVTTSITAQKNVVGSDYSPNVNNTTINKTITVGTSVANAAANGGDEVYSAISSIAAAGSVSIDLRAFTDLLNQTGALLARVKLIEVRLLSVADDAVIGTAASSVTVDGTVANGLVSQGNAGWLSNATSKFDVASGGLLLWGTPSAAGLVVDATHSVIKLTNNDGAVTAKPQVTAAGGST